MRIREARFSDLRAIAEVAAAAFADEELFGRLMHPHRNEYPEDFITFFEHKFLAHWVDHKRVILVSLGTESGKVVGVADWERQGHGVRKRELANVDPRVYLVISTSIALIA
jgi:hypothetical protein